MSRKLTFGYLYDFPELAPLAPTLGRSLRRHAGRDRVERDRRLRGRLGARTPRRRRRLHADAQPDACRDRGAHETHPARIGDRAGAALPSGALCRGMRGPRHPLGRPRRDGARDRLSAPRDRSLRCRLHAARCALRRVPDDHPRLVGGRDGRFRGAAFHRQGRADHAAAATREDSALHRRLRRQGAGARRAPCRRLFRQ